MAEILGIGMTHFPLMLYQGDLAYILKNTLKQDAVPAELKSPEHWPEDMQREWADLDAAAASHRARNVDGFRRVRAALDSFKPDVVLIWGDDQYENFRETVVPAFCVYAFDEQPTAPFHGRWGDVPNIWHESPDFTLNVRGHRQAATHLIRSLLADEFDVAYAYRAAYQHGLGHAHINTLVYLDYDRRGFDYAVIPFAVNCYGSGVIRHHGYAKYAVFNDAIDPPSPSPKRCFDMGAATARIMRDSPYRVALIASSSWSHAFLVDKHSWVYPDMDADRAHVDELRSGRFDRWRDLTVAQIEESGLQEFLNWVCLAGAMTELGYKADVLDWIESHVFNSNKAFAVFTADV
ncbi:MAG TPA: extradiol ring-cleavage dioxygenase [Chloroflexota bacterium]|nr:extradiol ring-cleavage dioxygenase [Chloroflexota bacterium]